MSEQATPHGSPVILVVSADERSAEVTVERHTRTVFGATPKETRNAALDLAAEYAAYVGKPVVVNARDGNGSWELIVSPTGVVRAAGGTEAALLSGNRTSKRGGRIALAAVGAALVLVVLAGGAVAAVRYGPALLPEEEPAEQPAVTMQTRQAPPGFTEQAAWRRSMHQGTRPDVAPGGEFAAYIDPAGRLRVVGPGGEPGWRADLPLSADEVVGPPRFVRAGTEEAVAVVGDGALWLWPPDGGTPEEIALPEGADVSFAGGAPLVIADGRASIPLDGELASVEKPRGTGAVLSDGEQVLAAVVQGPWTWVAPDGTTESVEPQAPEGADTLYEVYTAGGGPNGGYVVAAWSRSEEDDRVVLAFHDWSDGSVAAAADAPLDGLDEAVFRHSSGAAAFGPVVADPQDGDAEALEGFQAVSAAGGTVFGEAGGVAVATTAGAEPIELEGDVARPWGLLGGRAVVVADGDLYALAPE